MHSSIDWQHNNSTVNSSINEAAVDAHRQTTKGRSIVAEGHDGAVLGFPEGNPANKPGPEYYTRDTLTAH
eukprot:4803469-Pyramimonas_sp.AAC.2